MGECREKQPPVKIFFALMARDLSIVECCENRLAREFGTLGLRGELYAFDMTDYYEREFGPGLVKRIVTLEHLADPGSLADVKRRTNEIEEEMARKPLADSGRAARVVNIDPGYLSLAKVVLASTKDHAHRLYAGRGIFLEVTLHYRRGNAGFCPNPWTFRDYRIPERLDFFNRLRASYARQLKEVG